MKISIPVHLFFIFSYLTFFLFSCEQPDRSQKNEGKIIQVDPTSYSQVDMHDLVEAVEYIPLETNEEHFIKWINKIIPYKGRYYILSGGSIFVFDHLGKFIFTINRKGPGPGEYRALEDFLIDEKSDQIELYDRGNRKVIRFDLEGNFLNEFPAALYCQAFSKLPNGAYACNTGTTNEYEGELYAYNLLLLSPEWQLYKAYLPLQESTDGHVQFPGRLSANRNEGLMAYGFSQTIYRITQNPPVPLYTLDFGSYNPPAELLGPTSNDDETEGNLMKIMRGDYAKGLHFLVETDGLLSCAFAYPREPHQLLISKASGKSWHLPYHQIDGELYVNPVASDGEWMIGSIDAFKLLEMLPSPDSISESLQPITAELTEVSNPVLVRMKYADNF